MGLLERLKQELEHAPEGEFSPDWFRAAGYEAGRERSVHRMRADGIAAVFTKQTPWIYPADRIAGSMRPMFVTLTPEERARAEVWAQKYPQRGFLQNSDHFAPHYAEAVRLGIPGLLEKIASSRAAHSGDTRALDQLAGMETTLLALQSLFRAYAERAEALLGADGYDDRALREIRANCLAAAERAPETFAQGLQLIWMIHVCFVNLGKYAMALGRLDQILWPLYRRDVERGALTAEDAEELLACTLVKITEMRWRGGDDVVNLCIGGVDREGKCAWNELSRCILHAVRQVNLPGPNLSCRVTPDMPDEALDECLQVIGTGLGYPALMNDPVNLAALNRCGYEEADVRDYCMVGCIENFLQGKQPPWSDGRFDPIFDLEDMIRQSGDWPTMQDFMAEYERRLAVSVRRYAETFCRENTVPDPENHTSPFLSCFCLDCIRRARDINDGGSLYPSAHGAVLMGIGTVSDSLAALETVVYRDHRVTLSQLAATLRRNFEGDLSLRQALLHAPKYGNDDLTADRYAVWYAERLSDEFDRYRTPDGGRFYTAMAANTANIYAGLEHGATPDGRLAKQPLSDAASPTYGRDVKGVTSALLSLSRPDYTRCACGTVVNQKFSPSVFEDGSREKLLRLIRVYFARGGQEIQINATSRETLLDAMKHPEDYASLVVRVSGFSARFVTLAREVQEDILSRTQQRVG